MRHESRWCGVCSGAGAFFNLLDWGCHDGGSIVRVIKLQMHAPTDEIQFEHRTSPGGARDCDPDWLWAVCRVA